MGRRLESREKDTRKEREVRGCGRKKSDMHGESYIDGCSGEKEI